MIRKLAPDELEWFMASSYSFIGHSDPRAISRQFIKQLSLLENQTEYCFIYLDDDERPLAGLYAADEAEDDIKSLHLSNIWFNEKAEDLAHLVKHVLGELEHESVLCPLYNLAEEQRHALVPVFEALDFRLDQIFELEVELSDFITKESNLVLEAWSLNLEEEFRKVFEAAEGYQPHQNYWTYLKRMPGKFSPDLWFLARESLEQEAIGYALFGRYQSGGNYADDLDTVYYLSGVGVLQEHRHSTEMLKRVMLSSIDELASRSPLGRLHSSLNNADPKLIDIFKTLGFSKKHDYYCLVKSPQ